MSHDRDPQTADEHRYFHLTYHVSEYTCDPDHDPEFAAVLYAATLAEIDVRERGMYPPDGHGYPSTH